MIKLTKENTVKAVAKCKQLKPRVKFIKDRLFVVYSSNNSNIYHVSFDVRNGEKFGQCECKANEKGFVCYHIIAGATANIYRQGLKQSKPETTQSEMDNALYCKSQPKSEKINGFRI